MTTRSAVYAVVACSLAGCVTFRAATGDPATVARRLRGENMVHVTTRHGERLRLANVRLIGDSLVGVRAAGPGDRQAVALADIASMAVAETAVGPTVALVGTVVGVPLVLLGLLLLRSP